MCSMYRCLKAGAVLALWATLAAAVQAQEPDPDATAAPAVPAPAARLLVHSGLAAASLQRQYPDRSRWLETEEGEGFPALWFPEHQPQAQGALVLMADEGHSAGTGLLVGMARVLAEAGWAVLTLGLDVPPRSVRTLLENSRAQAAEETAAPSVMIDVLAAPDPLIGHYRTRVQARLLAAVSWLAEQGYRSLALAGVGRAAFHILDAEPGDSRVRTRIWVLPEFYAEQESELAQRLAARQQEALLELYPSPGEARGRERWVSARQAGFGGYRRQPVAVNVPPDPDAAHALANRILAWLQVPARQ